MAKTKVISSNPYRDNGGTVVMGGNVAGDSPITGFPLASILGFPLMGNDTGSQLTTSSGILKKALSSGALGEMRAGDYIMTFLTQELAGVGTEVMNSPANRGVKHSIHKIDAIWTTRVVQTGWDYVTGQLLAAPTTNKDVLWSIGDAGSTTSDVDDAANPSLAVPGEFIITDGSKNPQEKDYAARTQG